MYQYLTHITMKSKILIRLKGVNVFDSYWHLGFFSQAIIHWSSYRFFIPPPPCAFDKSPPTNSTSGKVHPKMIIFFNYLWFCDENLIHNGYNKSEHSLIFSTFRTIIRASTAKVELRTTTICLSIFLAIGIHIAWVLISTLFCFTLW